MMDSKELQERATSLRQLAAKHYTRQTRHISEAEYVLLNTTADELVRLANSADPLRDVIFENKDGRPVHSDGSPA